MTANTASLSAEINPEYADTKYYFEYVDAADFDPSASDPYGAGTKVPMPPGTDIGSAFGDQDVSVAVSGLAATTTYHFRVVVVNSVGATDGGDQTFTTQTPLLPSVDGESVANVGASTATLEAQVNPNWADTTYYFEYVDAADFDPSASDPYGAGTKVPMPPGADIGNSGTDQSASVNVAGLLPAVMYHFRVVAVNSVGTSYGSDQTFTTTPVLTGPGENVGQTTATLTGLLNPGGSDATYYFEYGPSSNYGTVVPVAPADVGSGTTPVAVSEVITGLDPHITYHFQLVGVIDGTTVDGGDQTFAAPYQQLPAANTSPAASVGRTTATLVGTVNPEGSDAGYQFQFGRTFAYGQAVPSVAADAGSDVRDHAFRETITGLEPNTTYHYRIVATSGAGQSYGDDVTFTTLPQAAIVSTSAAVGITSTTAVITGTINPLGADASYHFDYGTSTGYGTSVPIPGGDAGAGTTPQEIGQAITGLTRTPSTTTGSWPRTPAEPATEPTRPSQHSPRRAANRARTAHPDHS